MGPASFVNSQELSYSANILFAISCFHTNQILKIVNNLTQCIWNKVWHLDKTLQILTPKIFIKYLSNAIPPSPPVWSFLSNTLFLLYIKTFTVGLSVFNTSFFLILRQQKANKIEAKKMTWLSIFLMLNVVVQLFCEKAKFWYSRIFRCLNIYVSFDSCLPTHIQNPVQFIYCKQSLPLLLIVSWCEPNQVFHVNRHLLFPDILWADFTLLRDFIDRHLFFSEIGNSSECIKMSFSKLK